MFTLIKGQRALIGKCNMDRNSPPEYCEKSVQDSIDGTQALIRHIRNLPRNPAHTRPLVHPCITPRFALACTDGLMQALGSLLEQDPSLHVQTHLSENTQEISTTLDLFPGCRDYTEVYEKYGMLRKGTILAHCVWLSKQELNLIHSRQAGISHCPTSNFNLMSGGAKVAAMLDQGISVGLGSDCGGGFELGILPQIRDASKLSKLIALQSTDLHPSKRRKYEGKPLSVSTLFHMATLGGASICNMADTTGNFEVNKSFDALHISPGGSPGFFYGIGEVQEGKETDATRMKRLKQTFERFLFVGGDRDIANVWVQGRRVAGCQKA